MDIQFSPGNYKVAEDEALIFELRPPKEAIYWGFSVSDPWAEPLDVWDRQGCLNFKQAVADKDGVFRLVLAHRDPGIPNWIDICGYPEGSFTWRVTTIGKPQERPPTRLVKLADLRNALPPETPHVTPKQRREIVHRRQRHLQYRYSI